MRDILSGISGAMPRYFTNVNGTLYFQANAGATGYELWKSDGTSGGTVMVRNNFSGLFGYLPGFQTNFLGQLIFSASDGSGLEVWSSDGTSTGTIRLAEINPGPGSANPANFTVVGTKLFFSADNGTGSELWTLADVQPQVNLSINGSTLAEKRWFGSRSGDTVISLNSKRDRHARIQRDRHE